MTTLEKSITSYSSMSRFTFLLDYADSQNTTAYSKLNHAVQALIESSTDEVDSPFVFVIGRRNLFLYNALTGKRYKQCYIQ